MNPEYIRKKLRNGFHPSVIRTSDGREFPAPHKEFIMVTKRNVVIADEEG